MRLPVLLCTSLLLTTNTASSCSLDEEDLVSNAVRVQLADLEPVTDELIDKTFEYAKNEGNPFVYFQIYQGELYYRHSDIPAFRFNKVACLVRSLLLNEAYEIPDTTFVINLMDGDVQNILEGRMSTHYHDVIANTFPIFSFARDRLMEKASHFILFPDDYSIGSGDPNDFYMMGLGAGRKVIKEADKKPYSEKKKEIMWRGKNTGPHCHPGFSECLETPKMAAVNLSKEYPSFIDCKFAAPKHVISDRDREWGTNPADVIDLKGKADYQKLLVIDGIRSTFPGFALSLMYNAVVLKVEGSNTKSEPQNVWEQWFHSQLHPYYHFYPIDSLSMNVSLRQAYEYLERYPKMAEAIARRSNQFADEMLTPCAMEKYVALLLKGYEAKAKIGSRPPREGMKKISHGALAFCRSRHNNHMRHGLFSAGTLSSIVKKRAGLLGAQPGRVLNKVSCDQMSSGLIVIVLVCALVFIFKKCRCFGARANGTRGGR
eukprot:TRINITY_DN986_c0_g1_i16.p1 TRINITY_DN986_c0_g1~~TRINITY_DN986_c0_g1_i16.p1  ORF type:complete len:487 (+),score=175.48 TRINITY_DN986_c0_g1_i16:37-1497(+)